MTTPEAESTPQAHSRARQAPGQGASHGATAGIDLSILLTEYGRAMHRIGQLERELELLSSQTRSSSQGVDGNGASIDQQDAVASMRQQLAMGTNQLRQSEVRLEGNGDRPRQRRRRQHHRPWWKFWDPTKASTEPK